MDAAGSDYTVKECKSTTEDQIASTVVLSPPPIVAPCSESERVSAPVALFVLIQLMTVFDDPLLITPMGSLLLTGFYSVPGETLFFLSIELFFILFLQFIYYFIPSFLFV